MGTIENPQEMNDIEDELHGVENELQDFEERQVSVTRTLQMIVYPAMVAFIILSAYGFYLVQSLTTDVHALTATIADMHKSVETNMDKISGTMNVMTGQMNNLVVSTSQMTDNIVGMNDSTQNMAGNIQQMNASTQNMAVSTYNMQRDVWSMNKNISGPMKMFNKFTPFGSDKTTPYVVPPPTLAAPYYNYGYYGWPQPPATQSQPAQAMVPMPVVAASQPQMTPPVETGTNGATTAIQTGEDAVTPAGETMPAPATPVITPVPEHPDGAATAKDGHSALMPEEDLLTVATAIATK